MIFKNSGRMNIINAKTLRHNFREIFFVFLAFALMIVAAYFSVGNILRSRLLNRAEEMIHTAEANVRAGLSVVENTLLNSCHLVEGMIKQDASRQEILDYLTDTTEWMRQQKQGLLGFYGIHGYINGEYYDSIGLDPGYYFIPQTRPWYQTAIRSGNSTAYTVPYLDWHTGDTIVSAVRNLIADDGSIAGILTIDINIKHLVEYVNSLAVSSGGYGILISQNMTLMAHPNSTFMGQQLQDLGGAYDEIARILRSGGNVLARRINDSGSGNGGAKDPGGAQGSVIVFITGIFNGWYVGIITPYHRFYRDLYLSAAILFCLGFVLAMSLSYIFLRLSAAKMRSDEENKAKSSFLANMSHEIRTPMNAITGMAELLLREELPDEARGYAHDIKQAGSNLISIINDILDFSKIEAGKLEIVPAKYLLSSLINDTVSIVRMRLKEKPIRFYTNIEGDIPNCLIGDEVRVRQILLNLLSNAVKYTERGHIGLTVTVEKRDNSATPLPARIWISFAVTDTGYGIKPEDQAKLFRDFVQVDTKKNRSIEGTGLGLAITKRLCLEMGGDISVESEYGKGSEFTAVIPQGIYEEEPFAAVENAAGKKVLVYERRSVYGKSVSWSLENLKVPHTLVQDTEAFSEALRRENWSFVFSGYGLYDKVKPLMESTVFPEFKKPYLVLMVEWGIEAHIPNVRGYAPHSFVSLPVQSLSIANTLNGKQDSKCYFASSEISNTIRFTLPSARLLVVDDIYTNLKIAEGLLAPYCAVVDTCLNGQEAIELAKRRDYDLIFMDHMMPEMDGIETTACIRALGAQVPIIALTANAIAGMKEMFIEKGFNDFLAKPVDISKLDEILTRWIPKEKREQGTVCRTPSTREKGEIPGVPAGCSESHAATALVFDIPGLNTEKGIACTGGTEAGYRKILSMFCKDIQARLPLLQTASQTEDLPILTSQFHAIKGTSAAIGAAEVYSEAAELDAAGKAGDMVLIEKQLPVFAEHLTELVKHIHAALT